MLGATVIRTGDETQLSCCLCCYKSVIFASGDILIRRGKSVQPMSLDSFPKRIIHNPCVGSFSWAYKACVTFHTNSFIA
jgi:hypothetical protein